MIVLDLPEPLSVNRTRRIDWRSHKRIKDWQREANGYFLTQKRSLAPPIEGQYELTIVLREGSRLDLDNGLKLLIDSLRRFNLVTDDSPKYFRKLVVEFGDVEGCRVTVRSHEA